MAYEVQPNGGTQTVRKILKPSAFISTEGAKRMLQSMFSNPKTRDQLITEYLSACAANPLLAQCDPATSFPAYLRGKAMGFAYGVGQYDVIPYKDNRKGYLVAQFQIGAKGFKQLATRSGVYRVVDVKCVREGEYKGRNRFTGEPCVEFEQFEDFSKPIVGYFAYAIKPGDELPCAVDYMTREEAVAWGKRYSKSFNSGPWKDDFDKMACKTVIKRLCSQKLALSTEIMEAVKLDQAVLSTENDQIDYVDSTVGEDPAQEAPNAQPEPTPAETGRHADEDGVIDPDVPF